jgi:uncharacterized membrane protein
VNDAINIAFAPVLPWPVLGPLIAFAAVAALLAFLGRSRGRWWRGLVLALIALALLDPSVVQQQREPLKDVALIVADRSVSQHFGGRTDRTDAAVTALKTDLERFPDLETRVVESDSNPVGEETDLFGPRADALSDVPRERIAGTFLVTDGQVHDAPRPSDLAGQGPVHVLLTGEHGERDRRIEIVNAPSYGIVGKNVAVNVRITDANIPDSGPVRVSFSQDGGTPKSLPARPGETLTVQVPLKHAGPTTLEFEAEPADHELTLANNRAVAVVNGVRERLRVLLVSGEPHAGERTWRNLLKSDPSVDLVHFTILRPPEKNDGTPINELSLIAFPIAELFDLKLRDFDLIIFDHYEQRLLLPEYYENLANYVRKGGALLEASGPGFEGNLSLYRTALRDVLPGSPTGREIDEAFRPTVTDLGERHPVTEGLPGDTGAGAPAWGRWFRQGEVQPASAASNVVMTGAGSRPLLLLSHAGEGRVAQLASDQIWLWSRGFEGGGPQAELLRRLAHWLMKEPELDENQLTASAKNRQIVITRRSLEANSAPANVTVTDPDGTTRQATLQYAGHGASRATVQADTIGLYKIADGQRTAFAVIGSIDTPELQDVLTTPERLAPVVSATGGAIAWLADTPRLDIRRVDPDAPAGGHGWMGLRRNGRFVVKGITETPLLPTGVLLALLGGTLALAWFREGR